jgi:chromosome segregation ATPase
VTSTAEVGKTIVTVLLAGGATSVIGGLIGSVFTRKKVSAEADEIHNNTIRASTKASMEAADSVVRLQSDYLERIEKRLNDCETETRSAREEAEQASQRAEAAEQQSARSVEAAQLATREVHQLNGLLRRMIRDLGQYKNRVAQLEKILEDNGMVPPAWTPPPDDYELQLRRSTSPITPRGDTP